VVDSTDLGGDADLSRVQNYFEGRRKSSIGRMEEGSIGWRGRLDECRRVLESLLEHENTAGIPILVLANKQDRENCVEVVRIKEEFVRRVFEGE
jgi:ADP-ribosylation factor related protein 1